MSYNNNNMLGKRANVKTEVEVRVGKLKNGKAAGKDEIIREMVRGGDRVVD